MMTPEPDLSVARRLWSSVAVVAATYGFFLLFAEFAFLELVRATLPESGLRPTMGLLGAGGIVGSLAAGWTFQPSRWRLTMTLSYAGCALAATLALVARGSGGLHLAAALTGLALGWNTVTLAAGLRAWAPGGRLGWVVGLGTGIAYAGCNLPGVFDAVPSHQTTLSLGIALAGIVAATLTGGLRGEGERLPLPGSIGRAIVIFLVFVALDSAGFYLLQHTDASRRTTWTGAMIYCNAAAHFFAAGLAGWALDRGWLRGVVTVAWVGLAAACLQVNNPPPALGPLYATAVSLYSSALVFVAARSGGARRAALLFALAGWLGSAIGVGTAENLHTLPWPAVAVASGIVLVAGWTRARPLVALVALVGGAVVGDLRAAPAKLTARELRGREVYIEEGCMHCHSQYVRPHLSTEVERWGPAHPLEELLAQQPPLFGNRRQGPDLQNVGNRRTREWNRLHLEMPRQVSPGTRMPAYGYLFSGTGDRGSTLLDYLNSLGRETTDERLVQVLDWKPADKVTPLDDHAAARLFHRSCSQCHGEEGHGDGSLATRLAQPPLNWRRDAWRRGGDVLQVARTIKFGVPGTTMAGHEAWTDAEILGLAAYVKTLHQ